MVTASLRITALEFNRERGLGVGLWVKKDRSGSCGRRWEAWPGTEQEKETGRKKRLSSVEGGSFPSRREVAGVQRCSRGSQECGVFAVQSPPLSSEHLRIL